MKWAWPGKALALLLLCIAASATAGQAPENLVGFLPASGEVAGLTLGDTPQGYGGDDLYQMIDGGADIYHEYGFRQVLSAEYRGRSRQNHQAGDVRDGKSDSGLRHLQLQGR